MRIHPIFPIWIVAIIIGIVIFLLWFKKSRIKPIIETFIFILLFFINMRIQWVNDETEKLTNNLDVLFVIDTTISMNAEDEPNSRTRLDRVKEDTDYIMDKLNGARFSVITFNNTSRILIPYIQDVQMVSGAIQGLRVMDQFYAKGSNISIAKKAMLESLQSTFDQKDRAQIVFFFSDGEITNEEALDSFQELKQYVDNGAILGYGSEQGGKMKVTSYSGEEEYLTYYEDYKNSVALSKIEEDHLRQIAKDMDLDYIRVDQTNNLDSKIKEIKKTATSKLSNEEESGYEDTYYLFAIPLFLLLLLEWKRY